MHLATPPATSQTSPTAPRKVKRRHQRWQLPQPTAAQWREAIVVLLLYGVATIAMLWPYSAHLTDSTAPTGDPVLNVYVARWVQHALVTDPRLLYDANTFYPLEHTLAYTDSDVPMALLMVPIQIVTGNAILAHNLVLFATFPLAACGIYLLIRRLTGNRGAAFLAGLAYAFLPYRYAHLWHLQQLGHAWTPWILLAFFALIMRPTWLRAVVFGLLVATQVLTSFYLAFQIVLVLGIALIVAFIADRRTRSPRFLGMLATSGLLAAIIVVPLTIPYFWVRDDQGLERTLAEIDVEHHWMATPRSYLTTEDKNWVWEWMSEPHNTENALFPGSIAIIGAIAGLAAWRRRRAFTVALVILAVSAFVLSLGPTWEPDKGGTTALPYRFFFYYFPFFKSMRAPARFGIIVDFAVVLLAGFGAAWAWGRLSPRWNATRARQAGIALTVGLAALILLELVSTPVSLRQIDRSPAVAAPYEFLADQRDNDPVIEFPTNRRGRDTAVAMYRSMESWKPLVQGYSGFHPAPHREYVNAFDAPVQRPDGTRGATISHLTPDNVGLLYDIGVRWALVQRDGYEDDDWAAVLAQAQQAIGAPPVFQSEETAVYRVPAGPAADPQLRLSAPTEATANAAWSPILEVTNPLTRWALIYIKKPVVLTTVWRDSTGREALRERVELPVAVIGPPGTIRCTLQGCGLDGRKADTPAPKLPNPGQYTVELTLSGGLQTSATMPVTVR